MENQEEKRTNQIEKETFAQTAVGKKVSEPIYSHENGFYRYNYEIEQLEFIDHQTKTVTGFWKIPLDQWQTMPSQVDYCKKITENANKELAEARKRRAKAISVAIAVIVGWPGAVILTVLLRLDFGVLTILAIPAIGLFFGVITFAIVYPIIKGKVN